MVRSIAQRTLRDCLQETGDAISSGRVDVALANCQTILASFPQSLEAQRLLGEVYLTQGRLEDALHAFDWVLTNDPENVLAYCNRAEVSERMSDIDTALDCYQQAYELSRGNGQIREAFTQLSAKAGQQGFVFSRAGLARLYMRGGLLSQAIQEWEAVLTATPERLDARTGLLESCWREGSLNRVEELATQILQDVSGCVKALLLLAHVTAPKDMGRAQTLLQQVEALDPDLVMAQELFADMLVRYPDDAFLRLLKKVPSVLNTSSTPDIPPQANSVPPAATSSYSGQLPVPGTGAGSPGVSSQWENSQSWSKDAALLSPFSNGELQQNSGALWARDYTADPMAGSDTSKGDRRQQGISGLEPSDMAVQLSSDLTPMIGSWTMQEASSPSAPYQESQPEPWEMLQSTLQNSPSAPYQESQPEPWEMLQSTLQNSPPASYQESQPEPWEMLQSTLQNSPSAPYQESQPEPWEVLQDALHNMPGSITSQEKPQEWEDPGSASNLDRSEESWQNQSLDTLAESSPGSNDNWVSPFGSSEVEKSDWASATQENNPPSWLSMLTQADRKQMTSGIAPVNEYTLSAPTQSPEVASSPLEEPVPYQPAASPPSSSWEEELQSEIALGDIGGNDEDDESGFGPAWLKSLGATTLEQQEDFYLEQSAPSVSPLSTESEKQELPGVYASQNGLESEIQESSTVYEWKIPEPAAQSTAYEPWQTSASEPQIQSAVEPDQQVQLTAFDSESQPEAISSSPEKVEENLVATLEELEQQLHAQGFVAMEPKSLSAIAQAEEAKSTDAATPLSIQQVSQPVQETPQEQSLPSALTELGMMFQPPASDAELPNSSAPLTPDAADFPAEPLWLQALRSTPDSESDESAASPAFSTPVIPRPAPHVNVSQEPPKTPQLYMEAPSGLTFESTPAPASSPAVSEQSEVSNGQSAHANPFLESELETTMKRPAVRLQSMAYSAAPHDTTGISGKVRTSEPGGSPAGKIAENGNLNYKERLLKGYQHQLVGDYDEAMQDYRLVIRGAPELLGEIISNLRALLKLAPKYSAGYRVLGDAYMRQGEYLQAMESYNNALTMAKKARG